MGLKLFFLNYKLILFQYGLLLIRSFTPERSECRGASIHVAAIAGVVKSLDDAFVFFCRHMIFPTKDQKVNTIIKATKFRFWLEAIRQFTLLIKFERPLLAVSSY